MKLQHLSLMLLIVLVSPALAQTATQNARTEGKAFGDAKASEAQAAATTTPSAARVPGYGGTPTQSAYFNDPKRMAREAASQANSQTGYRTMRDSMAHRARFAPVDLDATIARSKAIAADPMKFASGMGGNGTSGRCVPLPPSSGAATRYMATCNTGYTASTATRACPVALSARTEQRDVNDYWCVGGSTVPADSIYNCDRYSAPQCRVLQSTQFNFCGLPGGGSIACGSYVHIDQVRCNGAIAGAAPTATTSETVVTTARDESACAPLAGDTNCTLDAETCTDSNPVTRTIAGVAVTQPCWAWQRSYTCAAYSAAQDCDTLEGNAACKFVRADCLTDQPCRTWERVYDCPVPDAPSAPNQFICGGDVYCIDGACETIDRQPNTEFKDAAVALNAMNDASKQFDPAKLKLFEGERASCASKVFGILNCCKGKGFPLIPGIQLLVALACSREEMLLHQRDAQGLCSYVGTYCASSFLGVCFTKRKVYCCFDSKLARILQEQGRTQLGNLWAKPRDETCAGFTPEEFARLDLSKMDFSEVYAEFTSAARLPDELQAATDIQQKIEAYYANASH